MEDGRFMEFIYFSSFMISVNFSDQLVTDMSDLVLKSWALWTCVNDDIHFYAQGGRTP